MEVLKFGGSSVANAQNISKVISILQQALETNDKIIIVLSAFGGITDALIESASLASQGDEAYKEKLQAIEQRHLSTVRELIPLDKQSGVLSMVKKRCIEIEDIHNGVYLLNELSPRTMDAIIGYGELLSTLIFSAKLKSVGIENVWKDARELIITNSGFGAANVDFTLTDQNIQEFFSSTESRVYIVPGFVASDKSGKTTTLGRGGSDYTAAIIGAALNVSLVEIWTDVSGMMTADPRLVFNAKIIQQLSYQEAMELSHFGAKVIYPPTIQPVMNKGIPVSIKKYFFSR